MFKEFGSDETPLHESEYVLPASSHAHGRYRRSFDHYVTVLSALDNQTIAEMVQYLNETGGLITYVIDAWESKVDDSNLWDF